jgi:hypothetical protein
MPESYLFNKKSRVKKDSGRSLSPRMRGPEWRVFFMTGFLSVRHASEGWHLFFTFHSSLFTKK